MEGVDQKRRTETEEESDFRAWDELVPDALGLIFRNLSLPEVLQVIPRVCKPWCKAVEGPYCWEKIDLTSWSPRGKDRKLDRLLRMLVTRSSGSLRELYLSWIDDDQLSFISEHAGSLRTLALKRSVITDSTVLQVASKLSSVTTLDLSYCDGITARAFEAIGTSCKALESLTWNMRRTWPNYDMELPIPNDDLVPPNPRPRVHANEGQAIARTMPNLKNLSIAYVNIDTSVVLEILSGCPELEFLNIKGCWHAAYGGNRLPEKYPKVKVVPVYNEGSDDMWTDTSSDSSSDDDCRVEVIGYEHYL